VFLGNGDGTFRAPLTRTLGFGLQGSWLETANINGGGDPDVIALGYDTLTGWRLYILYGDGDGTFRALFEVVTVASYGLGGRNASVAALNQGGPLDLVTLAGGDGSSVLQVLLGGAAGP
jgi:hypothetical protein